MAAGPVILLALETATDVVGAALVGPGGTTVERRHDGGRAHAELLVPFVEEVCATAGCPLSTVGALAVDVGPGLFTGLRVGVATAKALGQALGVGVVGVSSLDVLAAAGLERVAHRSTARPALVAVVDARRGEVFAAAYHLERAPSALPADLRAVRDDRTDPMGPDELAAWLAELAVASRPVVVVGDGALRYREQLEGRTELDLSLAAEVSAPSPATLAQVALARLGAGEPVTAPADLVPDYRRAADARINWEQRAPRPASGAPERGR